MTTTRWRCVWDIPGTPFPTHHDTDTELDAHAYALAKSTEIRGEVAVIPLPEETP